MGESPAASPPPSAGGFESIKRIEALRNRIAANDTGFSRDDLALVLAWADHLNYFLSLEKAENATLFRSHDSLQIRSRDSPQA